MGMAFIFLLSGCSSTPQAFVSPEKQIGQTVEIVGYLQYGFENRNLYPSANWKAHLRKRECVPLGIGVQNQPLLAQAEKLSSTSVVVSGVMQRLVDGTSISQSFCKDVGILITAIKPYP
jgi:hypothetical protein